MMAYLTDSEVYANQPTYHRFIVELASDEQELDVWEIPVPKDFKIIDVVVVQPTVEAIKVTEQIGL